MKDDPSAEKFTNRHHRTRANRQKAGMVSVLLHLPPALVRGIDQERGTRPRTEIVMERLMVQSGLKANAVQPTLRRGRPPTTARGAEHQSPIPTASQSVKIEPVSLRLADWGALLKKVPDPHHKARKVPVERKCWRTKGARGLTQLKWVYWKKDPREEYIKKLGGTCRYGKCTLRSKQADDFIKHFNLVDIKPLESIEPRYVGWSIQLVKCGTDANEFFEARVDFKAALFAASRDPAVARGLAAWLESRRKEQHRWYQITASSGGLSRGMLICEPLQEQELSDMIFWGPHPAIHREQAPEEWRQAWAAIVLQGHETADGSIRPKPHTGCPGHRVGSLLAPWLEAAANKSEARLPRSEWDAGVKRAEQFGVTAKLVPKPPSRLLRAFDPSTVPGWEVAARGGHHLFAYQREAVRFALDRKMRCLIADEMGLGKTASAIAALHAVAARRTLVVCPVNAIGVW